MFAILDRLPSRRHARLVAAAAAHHREYMLTMSDPRSWDDEDLALYTRDEIDAMIAENNAARAAAQTR